MRLARKYRRNNSPYSFSSTTKLKRWLEKHIGMILTVISTIFVIVNIHAISGQNENAIKLERNGRFKNAIDQLGDDKSTIVLGGIYTLHRIAEEDESYTESVFKILSAYVRDTTKSSNYQAMYEEEPSEPIQTILELLSVNEADFKVYYKTGNKLILNFANVYLRGANLKDASLIAARLEMADLAGVNLASADLTGAILHAANLEGTFLSKANLSGAYLTSANLTAAFLSEANLRAAFLSEANLTDAFLNKSDLRGAYSAAEDLRGNVYFEERVKYRIGKETDLSEIKDGYDPEDPQFRGKPVFGVYDGAEAEEIIKDYNNGGLLDAIM